MITKLTHTTFFVDNQEKAYDFYVNKLGFAVRTDTTLPNGYRWLTVSPPEQPDTEIILMEVLHPTMKKKGDAPEGIDEESMEAFRVLLKKGVLGAGVMSTPDCRATYEELKAKGVVFQCAPREQFYGTEAVMFDGCGNWFSVMQPREQ